ncbi:MAG TPA: CRISPR system precrRNA processing endoribonuclease RAMP protein Cas6 [Thermodesulfobacteriota bacterium]|nr:CRISPR system precrRNA processing endoribonuclease RAMP protein Cas6 [Thermodesulfobacteriota bacterium]
MTNLEFAKYRFVIRPRERLILPAYKGSTFRGGFGHAFKRVTCLLGKEKCSDGCRLKDKCMYHNVFDAPAMHPFVIEPPLEDREIYGSDDLLSFNLILIGRAIEYFPYFLFTFEELGRLGIGRGRGQYWLEDVFSVGQDEETRVYSQKDRRIMNSGFRITVEEFTKYSTSEVEFCGDGLRTALTFDVEKTDIELLTPVRLKYKGNLTSDLDFYLLFRAILMRLAALMDLYSDGGEILLPSGYKTDAASLIKYFYSYKELEPDSRTVIHQAISKSKNIATERGDLSWMDWERYSNRQGERMKLGGVVGKVSFTGPLGKFLPYLLLAEYIHVGKETTFGLGKIKVISPF